VVLTPGSFNETYFEHAYLARQLGLPLVEGHDLTVRGDTVYLKTLGGLRRVHAILRRLDDDFCDPVELRADSALGVPGLISVVRAGRVVIANALGSGVLESAAWMGFIPRRRSGCWGRSCRLPSVATWWCGERLALEYVLEHLERLVIKPTYPNQNFEAVFGRDLDSAARADLAQRIRARPHAYVAQERLAFFPGSGVAQRARRRVRRARARDSRLCDCHRIGLSGHAGRAGAHCGGCGGHRLHAARRRQQGCVGAGAGPQVHRRGQRGGRRACRAPPCASR
jgi:uncharacterized circularly permuted ATP-grasp superfamily protein